MKVNKDLNLVLKYLILLHRGLSCIHIESDPSLIGLQERSSNVLHFYTSLNYILLLQYTVKLNGINILV